MNPTTNEQRELIELCKEVYKRTGWEDKQLKWLIKGIVTNNPYGEKVSPAYTSDYLLEKLPKELHKDGMIYYLALSAKYGDEFKANYVTPTGHLYLFLEPEEDTPLETLLELVIALDDAGVKL